jgi:hypothetical protein
MGDHEQQLEDILAKCADTADQWDTHTVDFSGVYSNVSTTSPYTLSSITGGVNLGGLLPNSVYTCAGTATVNRPWTVQSTSAGTTTVNHPWTVQKSSTKIKLDGADADIEINGVSLWKTMQEISNRLNIMQVNPELETQWRELQELGERYRKLEQHILDKQATFDRIRAMPAPHVD